VTYKLKWEDYPNPVFAGPDIAVANVQLLVTCVYQVQRDPQGPGFMAFAYPKNGAECWSSRGHADIEAAKVAAQKHIDELISSLSAVTLDDVEGAFFAGFAEGCSGTWVEGDPTSAWREYAEENLT
jgi:hypothetical protein